MEVSRKERRFTRLCSMQLAFTVWWWSEERKVDQGVSSNRRVRETGENVGEGRGEKEERAEGWWLWWGLVWCCVVLWSGGVCLYTAQQNSVKGAYTARTLSVRSSLQNMAGEELAHHVVTPGSFQMGSLAL